MSHGSHVHFLGFASVLGFPLMTHDMIQCGMTWQWIQLHSHMIHVTMGLTGMLSDRFT